MQPRAALQPRLISMATRIRPTFIPQAVKAPCSLRSIPIARQLRFQQKSIRPQSYSTASINSSSSSSSNSTPIPESAQPYNSTISEQKSTAQTPVHFEPLSYFVHRTPSQQLPVYHLAKRGGNKHQTRIRKVSGDLAALRDDLAKALGLGEKEIAINSVNGHIVIKGWKKVEVAKFLQEKRF